MTNWTQEHINTLAPDSSSLKNGRSLAVISKWQTLGQKNGILWGEIKGSGSKPYQTSIEQATPSFKCSCPSRKFPCKHGLGLAFIYAMQADALKQTDYPDWVAEWVEKREQSAKRKTEKAIEKPVDEVTLKKREQAQQKRKNERDEKISAGITECQTWLYDRVRQGLAQTASDYQLWQNIARRMIDAQAPALATRLHYCQSIRFQETNWQEKLLSEVSKLHLLLSAYQQRNTLPEDVQADIAMHLGITSNKNELLEQQGITDDWLIIGQATEEKDNLRTQRTWLYGKQQQRFALLLDFAVANQAMTLRPAVGTLINAELVFYPNTYPVRALIKQDNGETHNDIQPFITMTDALNAFYRQLALSPWLTQYPCAIKNIIIAQQEQHWLAIDKDTNTALPLTINEERAWQLMALSGGLPINLFAEWDGEQLNPLSLLTHQKNANIEHL